MPALTRFPADADFDAIGAALEEEGVVLIDDLFSSETIATINADLDGAMAAADPKMPTVNEAVDAFFGGNTKHVGSLAAHSRTYATEVMIHPLFMALCDRILLPSCARYQLNLATVINRGPNCDGQIFHRDEDVWVHMPKDRPQLELATMVALVDFTKENGATMVVPGSHHWPERMRQPVEDEIAHAEMSAGSAVIYLGSTVHAGGGNSTTDTWRRGAHMSYCLGWLRTEENNYLGTPPSIAKDLPVEVQEILGYAVHDAIDDIGGYLGALGMQDPMRLLANGSLQ